ncbi:divalent-cation tolerance protein CutA [Sphingomonas sp. MA1305]|uniref:divalent-cation tolerance protein CutA n=1 Tax=Sphingomonas sp. MA1305 TaxID=2479204 RepID=UPI0018E030DA|nr:divalent-cation tolerance protein CutA [Sphingomonas sp. MA1305]
MTAIALVQATFADLDEAGAIGGRLVVERLVACTNILAPCLSLYRWQDAVESGHEALAQFKTLPERVDAVVARIADLHSYTLPAIEYWTVETNEAGAAWVRDCLTG